MSKFYYGRVTSIVLVFFSCAGCVGEAFAQITKEELEAAKYEQELRVLQATAELQIKQKEAEARKAIADAEKAELAAKLPTTDTKALTGKINTEKFGAAGLVKAFDLARGLSKDVCTVLRSRTGEKFSIYDATIVQGVVAARLQNEGIEKMLKTISDGNDKLLANIDPAFAPKNAKMGFLLGLGALTTGVKAVADLASLAKQDVTVVSATYGTGTRPLFISALAENCGDQVVGLGAGYMGELDLTKYRALMGRVEELIVKRGVFADNIAKFAKQVEAAKEPTKEPLVKLLGANTALLKTVDSFIEGLKVGDQSDKSPLYNIARYLAYSERTMNSKVIDFDLTLEGMTINKDSIFTGQRLSLSAVALFWYRIYNVDGGLLHARTIRQILPPISVDLKGTVASDSFWNKD